MTDPHAELHSKLEAVRAGIAGEHGDPRALFDEVQVLIDQYAARNEHVPDELREAVAELEAEIVEDFYDNLPV